MTRDTGTDKWKSGMPISKHHTKKECDCARKKRIRKARYNEQVLIPKKMGEKIKKEYEVKMKARKERNKQFKIEQQQEKKGIISKVRNYFKKV